MELCVAGQFLERGSNMLESVKNENGIVGINISRSERDKGTDGIQ